MPWSTFPGSKENGLKCFTGEVGGLQFFYMKKITLLILSFLLLMQSYARGIDYTKQLTLPEAIAMARTKSVDAVVARGELKSAYWEFRTYQANLLPELTFDGTAPQFNKSYSSYQQDDGSYKFIRNNWFGMNGALNVNQNIWLTGGQLSLSTSLDLLNSSV